MAECAIPALSFFLARTHQLFLPEPQLVPIMHWQLSLSLGLFQRLAPGKIEPITIVGIAVELAILARDDGALLDEVRQLGWTVDGER